MDDDTPSPASGPTARSEVTVAIGELRQAAAFLTRLPAALFGADPTQAPHFTHAARVFPVIGALVGLAGGIVLTIALWLGIPSLVAAGLGVGAIVLITGGLHEDGLADTADSFGGATAEKRLAIMDDSRVGTFGALALAFSVLIRVAAVAAIAQSGAWRAVFALIAAEAVSRAALVRFWYELPAARTGGLSSETGPPDQNAMLVALAIGAVCAIVFGLPALGLWATVLAFALSALATWVTIRVSAHSIGGRTGDTLGACQQAAVIGFLAGAAAA